jgi:hypothetical protein
MTKSCQNCKHFSTCLITLGFINIQSETIFANSESLFMTAIKASSVYAQIIHSACAKHCKSFELNTNHIKDKIIEAVQDFIAIRTGNKKFFTPNINLEGLIEGEQDDMIKKITEELCEN